MNTSFTLYISNQVSNPQNTHYPTPRQINRLQDLKQATAFDHVAAEYTAGRRNVAGFIASNCV